MEIMTYHTDHGYRSALIVNRGRKLMQLLLIESAGVILRKVRLTEERYMKPLTRKGAPYPEKRALAKFRHAARTLGASKAVREVLR